MGGRIYEGCGGGGAFGGDTLLSLTVFHFEFSSKEKFSWRQDGSEDKSGAILEASSLSPQALSVAFGNRNAPYREALFLWLL